MSQSFLCVIHTVSRSSFAQRRRNREVDWHLRDLVQEVRDDLLADRDRDVDNDRVRAGAGHPLEEAAERGRIGKSQLTDDLNCPTTSSCGRVIVSAMDAARASRVRRMVRRFSHVRSISPCMMSCVWNSSSNTVKSVFSHRRSSASGEMIVVPCEPKHNSPAYVGFAERQSQGGRVGRVLNYGFRSGTGGAFCSAIISSMKSFCTFAPTGPSTSLASGISARMIRPCLPSPVVAPKIATPFTPSVDTNTRHNCADNVKSFLISFSKSSQRVPAIGGSARAIRVSHSSSDGASMTLRRDSRTFTMAVGVLAGSVKRRPCSGLDRGVTIQPASAVCASATVTAAISKIETRSNGERMDPVGRRCRCCGTVW